MNDPQPNNGTHHRQVLTGARVVHFLDLHLLDLVQAALIAGEIDEGYGVSGQGRPIPHSRINWLKICPFIISAVVTSIA